MQVLPLGLSAKRCSLVWHGLALCGALIVLSLMPAGAAGRGDWWLFQHDVQHTGRSPFAGPNSPLLRWVAATASGNPIQYSSPAIGADGSVYFGANDHNLYALNGATGARRWLFPTGNNIDGSPAIGTDGTIYVGSNDDNLYAIDPNTGAKKWAFTTGFWIESSPVIDGNGTIYIGSDDDNLYAVNSATGKQYWAYTAQGGISSSPAISADGTTIYVGSWDNNLYAVNASTGKQKWAFTTGSGVSSSPSIGGDGTVYVGSFDNNLYAIDPTTGKQKWAFAATNYIYSSPAISPDGTTVYVGSWDKKLYAVNASTGKQKWAFTTGASIYASPVTGKDGTIYVGSADHLFYAINPTTGTQIWSFDTGGIIYSSAAIGADGTLYFANYNGNCYAISQAMLSLTKSVNAAYLPTGGTANYTISAVNSLGAPLSGITLTDPLPTQLTYVTGSATGGGAYNTGTRTLTWPLGALNTGASATVGFQATVNAGTLTGTVIANTMQGVCAQTSATATSNTAAFTVLAPALSLAKSVHPLAVMPGGVATYKLMAANIGNNPATNVVLSDILPAQLTYVNGSASGVTYNATTRTLSWALGTLNAGASAPTMTFQATVNATTPTGTTAMNVATVICDALLTPVSSNAAIIYIGATRAGDWWTFHRDQTHTGHSPYTGLSTAQQRWAFLAGLDVYSSPAIAADGTIYVGSLDDNLYAISPAGKQKWAFLTGGSIMSSPAIGADGTVYVGSFDKNVYALDPATGKPKWVFPTGNWVKASPTIGADGTVYVASFDKNLYALDPTLGTAIWSFTMGSDAYAAPAIGADGTIYLASEDDYLYALNPATGVKKWAFKTGNAIYSSPAISADGTMIYVGSEDHKLYAVNATTGLQKWAYATNDVIYSSPAIATDGTIYIGSSDNSLYAINATGTKKWSYATGNWLKSSPTIGGDGTVYVGSYDKSLYAINPSTGKKIWSFPTTNCVESTPAIGADGTIYCGSDDHNLYAIGTPILCQPDLSVCNYGDTSYLGAGVYNTTGTGQTKSQTTTNGVSVRYLVQLKNAGNITDGFTLTCPTPGTGWTLQVVDQASSTDITASIVGSGWSIAALSANSALTYTVNLTPSSTVLGNASTALVFTAVSVSNSAKSDVVQAVTTVAPSYQPDLAICNNGDATYLGFSIFNGDGSGQTKSQSTVNGVTATYLFQLKNAGNTADVYSLTCPTAASGWTIQFIDSASGKDVTNAMNTGVSVSLASGASANYLVHITPGSTLTAGTVNTLPITAVSTASSSKADTVKAVTTVLSCQPDLLIRTSTEITYLGQGVINLDGTNQTKSLSVASGLTANYLVKVLNAGTTTDSFVLTASAAATGWTVKAFDNTSGASITTALNGAGWTVGPLAPGASIIYSLFMTPGSGATVGVPMSVAITAVSQLDGTKKDVVKAVTTALGYQPDLLIRTSADSAYIGQGIINLNGASQSRSQSVSTGAPAGYYVKVLNAGTSADSFILTASGSTAGWTLTATDLTTGTAITAALTGAGWTVGPLAPGASAACYIVAIPGSAIVGVPMTVTLTAVSKADGTKKDVVTAITTALGYQPDLLIRAIGDAVYLGQGIINLDGTNQTRSQSVTSGGTAGYMVQVLNAGSSTDTFVLTASPAASGWTLKAFNTASGASIITALTGSGWTVGPLAPGAGISCNLYAVSGSTVTSGQSMTVTLLAVSLTDGTRKDVAKAVTTEQ